MICFPTGMVIWESQSARRVLLICQCFVWHFRFLFTPCINEFRPCQVRPIKKPFNPGRTILNLLAGNPTWLVSKRKNLSLDLSPSTPAAPAGAGAIRQIYDNCKNSIGRCSNTKKTFLSAGGLTDMPQGALMCPVPCYLSGETDDPTTNGRATDLSHVQQEVQVHGEAKKWHIWSGMTMLATN